MLCARLREVSEDFLKEVMLGLRCKHEQMLTRQRGRESFAGRGNSRGIKWYAANREGHVTVYSK